MVYPASEIIILNDDEFLMLLAASGLESWYGIELSEQQAALDDIREFNSCLASLYQKGLVEWEGDKAGIAAAYKGMFRTLRDAGRCILVKTESRPGYIRGCYYSGGNIVSVERGTAAENEVELSVQGVSEWISELREQGCLPGSAVMPDEGEEPFGAEDLISEFELRSVPGGELLKTLRLYEQGLYTTKEIVEGTGSVKSICGPDDAGNILGEWFGGTI